MAVALRPGNQQMPLKRNDVASLTVSADATVLDALKAIDAGKEAISFVVSADGRVIGSLTDGDVRRALLAGASLESRCLASIMHAEFISVREQTGRAEVLDVMRSRQVEQIPVLDADGRLCGMHSIREMITEKARPNSAVILAGGRGTRLHPLTDAVPKPMLPVAGRPILERLVMHLMGFGVTRIYLSVNYLGHVIEKHFGDGSALGCSIEYLKERKPLGTGGPLSLLPHQSDPVVVVNGDLVTQCDFGSILDFHQAGGYAATFGVRPYLLDIPFGVAEVDGDRLVAIREKPTEKMLVNAGIYVLSPAAIRMVPSETEYPITTLFSDCIAAGMKIGAPVIEDEWLDVGRHDELRRARGH
jgi:dTDP-glucose pyrophosphorylase/CBS domain-containing protein